MNVAFKSRCWLCSKRLCASACAPIHNHQRPSVAIRGHPRSSEVIRGHPRSSEVIRSNPKQSEAIRGHPKPYEVIRGNPRQSEAIRGIGLGAQVHVTDNIELPHARCQSGFVRELLHLLQARILPRRLGPFRHMPKFGWGVGHEILEPLVVGAQHRQQDRRELLEARVGRLRQAQHLACTRGPCSVRAAVALAWPVITAARWLTPVEQST